MREKLIELIRKADKEDYTSATQDQHYEFMADQLIANGVTIQRWIPVSERLPEERDSVFAKFYGTERWTEGMFLKISKDVLTCVEYEDGTKAVKALHTNDGKWHLGFKQVRVTHWMPLPQPPKEEI